MELVSEVKRLAEVYGVLGPSWPCRDLYTKDKHRIDHAERHRLLMRVFYLLCTSPEKVPCPQRLEWLRNYLINQWGPIDEPMKFYPYPWVELDELETVPLLGFGSLINRLSAAVDLRGSGEPAIAFGMRRIFNYCQDFMRAGMGLDRKGEAVEHAKLNALYTGDAHDVINGLLYHLHPGELVPLRERELGYDLIQVPIIRYGEAFDSANRAPKIIPAYMLIVPEHLHAPSHTLPHVSYLHTCIEGAYHHGAPFVDLFLHSTYLADGQTRLEDWVHQAVRELL